MSTIMNTNSAEKDSLTPPRSIAFLTGLAVNGRTISPGGRHKDVVLFPPDDVRNFEVVATMS